MTEISIQPYYQESGITIYHGDCREILNSLPYGVANRCKSCTNECLQARRYSVAEKRCSTCKTVKSAADFDRSNSTPNGLQSICRVCTVNRRARKQEKDELERMAHGLSKRCMVCEKEKPLNAFRYSKHAPDKHTWRCKECYNNAAENLEKIKAAHVPFKYCPTCKSTKDADCFTKKQGSGDGLAYECKQCVSTRSKPRLKAIYERRKATLAPRNRTYYLKRTFGIDDARYQEMLEAQNGRCAICGNVPDKRKLAVDHDHDTGMIRGLLCTMHNTALGMFDDDAAMLQRAIEYLLKPPFESAAYQVPPATLGLEMIANFP